MNDSSPIGSARLWTLPFALAFVASFLSGLSFHGFLHLPGFVQKLGADEFEIGVVMGTMNAVAVLTRPFVGRVMDRHGRKVVVVSGSTLALFACLAYLLIEHVGAALYFVRILHGMAGAAMFSVLFTIAADLVPADRVTEGIAVFGVSGMLAIASGGMVGDLVLEHGSYADLFLVSAGFATLALLMVLPLGETRPVRSKDDAPARSYMAAISDPALRPLWLVGLGFAISVASYFSFLKTFVLHRGIGSVGLFFGAYAVTAVVLRIVFGWLPDRLGPKRILYPSLACGAAGTIVLAFAGSGTAVSLAGILSGAGHGFAFPIISGLVVRRAPISERGAAISMFTAIFDLGLLVGSPLLGAIITASSYQTMYLSAAGIVTIVAITFAVWDRY